MNVSEKNVIQKGQIVQKETSPMCHSKNPMIKLNKNSIMGFFKKTFNP